MVRGWFLRFSILFLFNPSIEVSSSPRTNFLAAYREASDPTLKARILLNLSVDETLEFVRSPGLTIGELRQVSDVDLRALIDRVPSVALHPIVLGALREDVDVLLAFRSNPGLSDELKNEVPLSEWVRLKQLWTDYTVSVLQNAGDFGCSAVVRGLGLE